MKKQIQAVCVFSHDSVHKIRNSDQTIVWKTSKSVKLFIHQQQWRCQYWFFLCGRGGVSTFWLTGQTLPRLPTQFKHTEPHTFTLMSSLKLKAEIRNKMCEAHVSTVTASQTHRLLPAGQIHAGGESGFICHLRKWEPPYRLANHSPPPPLCWVLQSTVHLHLVCAERRDANIDGKDWKTMQYYLVLVQF